jgi:hypothetical protein
MSGHPRTLASVTDEPLDPGHLFADEPAAIEAYGAVKRILEPIGPVEVRTTRSQVAFRRRRGFAYLWLPVSWARSSGVLVVLSIALARQDKSGRWKLEAGRPSEPSHLDAPFGGPSTDRPRRRGPLLAL